MRLRMGEEYFIAIDVIRRGIEVDRNTSPDWRIGNGEFQSARCDPRVGERSLILSRKSALRRLAGGEAPGFQPNLKSTP